MKRNLIACIVVLFIAMPVSLFGQKKSNIEKNMKIATLYHELEAENVDKILTDDFVGQNEKGRHTWDKENHRNYLSNGKFKRDSIYHQIAEGDWVATSFFREMVWDGDTVKFQAMHFKRFENGKIAEIWEYADTAQVKEDE